MNSVSREAAADQLSHVAFPADCGAAALLTAVNALFFSGDFREDRTQKKKISAPPRH
jgi:hypothetical protein